MIISEYLNREIVQGVEITNEPANVTDCGTPDYVIICKMTKNSVGWEPTNKEKSIGRVCINDNQYFDNIPLVAWEFHTGGYQPAQKWLKDRNGRNLHLKIFCIINK